MTNFCPHCGSPVEPTSAYCAQCGGSLAMPAAARASAEGPLQDPDAHGYPPTPWTQPPYPQPPFPPPARRISPRLVIGGLVSLVVLGIIGIVVGLSVGGNGPEGAVQDYAQAYTDGDCSRAVELTYFGTGSTKTRPEVRAECENSADVDFTFEVLGTRKLTGDLPDGVSAGARVDVKVTAQVFGNQQSNTSNVVVYKVDGTWLVKTEAN